MARTIGSGNAQSVSTESFNERIKRAFEGKADPAEAPQRQPGKPRSKPVKPTTST